jgi:predicted nucleotidyltransferase component of viral defense system
VNVSPTYPDIRIQVGHVTRHMPTGAQAQGREAAVVDIAQDILLRHLSIIGVMDALAFKGGTALRKLYAGKEGRFSLDLDFSIRNLDQSSDAVLQQLEAAVDGLTLGPFEYALETRRGRRHLLMSSAALGSPETLSSKIDLLAPSWLPPVTRTWVPMPIHRQYGEPALPALYVVRLEENIAEKIARLNRQTPARDMYDLDWAADHLRNDLDWPLVRRLAVLKIWVDTHGVSAAGGLNRWGPGHRGGAFEADTWLRRRSPSEYDEEDIGALAVPPPKLEHLSERVSARYAFLAKLDDDERSVSRARANDRPLVLRMLAALPGARLEGIGLH